MFSDQFIQTLRDAPDREVIWTPDHPLFGTILHSKIPPGETLDGRFYAVRDETGLLQPMTETELEDYLFGGEFDEVTADDADL